MTHDFFSPVADPGEGGRRKRVMLQLLDKTSITKRYGPPSALFGVGRLPQAGKVREVAQADRPQGEWVAQMTRVARQADEAAFAELFAHFAPRIKAFLMKSGSNAALAEECAQDVMATVWHKAQLFDPARASVATWIFTIARNRRIDALRKARRPEPEDLPWGPEPEPDQADAMVLQQESERLGVALARLPENQRTLIEQAYFGDLSHGEIAKITGLPLGTIKSRIRLALEKLRQAMT